MMFPLKQVLVIGGILFTHHFGSGVIFPFLPFLTHDFFPYLKSNQLGYYAGFLASAYFTGSLFGSFMWGRLSDMLGRRPILLFSIVSCMLSSVFFGFSLSFGWAVGSRFLWGFVDGNLGVAKTYIFEATEEVYHAFTFSLVGASSGLGRLVGPMAGGFLSCPAARIPGLDVFILRKFPYLLPCLVVVVLAITNLTASCCFLKETRWDSVNSRALESPISTNSHENQRLLASDEDSGIEEKDGEDEVLGSEQIVSKNGPMIAQADDRPSVMSRFCSPCCKKLLCQQKQQGMNESVPVRKLLSDRRILLSCVLYGLLGFAAIITNELLSLLLVSNHKHGGYNFDTSEISLVLTGAAVFQIFSQLVVFPLLAKKFSYKTLFRAAILLFMIGTLCTPFMNQMTGPIPQQDVPIQNSTEIVPHYTSDDLTSQKLELSGRNHEFYSLTSSNDSTIGKCRLDDDGSKSHVAISDVPLKVWAVVVFTSALTIVGRVSSFTAVMVMIGNSALPYFRGTVNGISQSLVALARLLGPIIGGNLFAWTTENGLPWPLNFHLAFYLAVLIGIIILLLSLKLPDSINRPRLEGLGEDTEEDFIDDTSALYNQQEHGKDRHDQRVADIA